MNYKRQFEKLELKWRTISKEIKHKKDNAIGIIQYSILKEQLNVMDMFISDLEKF